MAHMAGAGVGIKMAGRASRQHFSNGEDSHVAIILTDYRPRRLMKDHTVLQA